MPAAAPLAAARVPLAAAGDASVRAAQRALDCVKSARGRRVLYLLIGVWMLNLFDLTLTLRAWADGMMHEENPLARSLLEQDPAALLIFKLLIVAGATAILFNFRRFRCAEIASTVVLVVYTGVALQWKLCYELYDIAHTTSIRSADFAHIESLMRLVPMM
jgi:hypothetical protein